MFESGKITRLEKKNIAMYKYLIFFCASIPIPYLITKEKLI